jgi:broad specificity phosphatase PhoE
MAIDPTLPLVFVRHGETDWNRQGLIQGSVDTELNDNGRKQAAAVAQLLAVRKQGWQDFQVICSPQQRARQTAQFILDALTLPLAGTEPRVRELGFGIWEGKPFWELKDSPIYPADPEGRFYWRPEGGESYEDGVARVNQWRAELTRPTLVVSHGAVGRCLMGTVAGLAPHELVTLKTPQGAYCDMTDGRLAWFDGVDDPA